MKATRIASSAFHSFQRTLENRIMVCIGCAILPFTGAVIIGWAALACLVLLPMWSPAAALDWHIPMPGSAWRMGEGSGELCTDSQTLSEISGSQVFKFFGRLVQLKIIHNLD